MRRSLGIAVLLVAWAAPSVSRAAEDKSATPALAGESSRIKPAAERQLGAQSRPTIKKKEEKKAEQTREVRVSLQIPEALRPLLAKKIDQRIARNLEVTHQLRLEAHGLL